MADVGLVSVEALSGVVRFEVPYVGYAFDFMSQRSNYYFIVGIPAALLILSELYIIAREFRRRGTSQVVNES